jgi:hypothetical protein
MMRALAIAGLAATASTAHAAAAAADAWLDGLYDRAAADVRAGRPIVVEAHVALCDNRVIPCGSRRLGDGDSVETNLYWASSGGLRGWFGRRGSGWTEVARRKQPRADVLEESVWKRRVTPTAAWRRRGVEAPFDVYVVASAWRGVQIDRAIEAYLADVFGHAPRLVAADEKILRAGGAAHLVAYVGHNRLMDRPPFDFAEAARAAGEPDAQKGTIAVACASARYLARGVAARARVPLLMTSDLLFAGSHGFEGAVRAFLDGAPLADIRLAAARAYAEGEGKPLARVLTVFTNPSDPRWR